MQNSGMSVTVWLLPVRTFATMVAVKKWPQLRTSTTANPSAVARWRLQSQVAAAQYHRAHQCHQQQTEWASFQPVQAHTHSTSTSEQSTKRINREPQLYPPPPHKKTSRKFRAYRLTEVNVASTCCRGTVPLDTMSFI